MATKSSTPARILYCSSVKKRLVAGLLSVALLVSVPTIAWATSILDAALASFNFGAEDGTEQTAGIGEDAIEGFTYRYEDVLTIGGQKIDAVATILDITNLDSDDVKANGADNFLDFFDRDSPSGREIDLSLDVFGDSGDVETGSVTFRIDFVLDGTTDSVILENIGVLVKDIDSNQFVKFAGITGYELSATPPTELNVTSSGGLYTFAEPSGNSSSSSDEENWVAVTWDAISSVEIIAGANEPGGASYGISFMDTTWTASPTATPVSLTAYDVAYDSNSADSGSVPSTQSSTTSSSVVTLSAPQGDLVRSGFTFSGWNTRTDGTGANYETGDRIALGSDVTLFATWTAIPPAQSGETVESRGIFLYIAGQPARKVEATPVYYGSVSIKPNTTYILSIQSVTNPALTRTILATGTTNDWGHADQRLEMNDLAPGTYKVVMTGTHRLDYPLVLTNYISVDRNGNFISLSPERLQPTLN